ncbi:MAG TPA: DUF362 domain-containing protein [Chloroflexota bacterium]
MKTARRVPEPIVAISHGEDEAATVERALHLLPLERLIRPGDRVVVKPNWVGPHPLDSGAVTRPATLRAVLQALKRLSPGSLVVAEGTAHPNIANTLSVVGADVVLREEDVRFVDLNHDPFVEVPIEHYDPTSVVMNAISQEIDVLVSLCQLKEHEEATVSLSMKNIALAFPAGQVYGYPKAEVSGVPRPGRRDLHSDLHGFIVAMNKILAIDLAIVSGHVAMVGTGPSRGKAVPARLVLAGTDPVATDVVAARLLGYKPQAVAHLYRAIANGLGEGDVNRIEMRGVPYEDAARLFSQAAYGKEIVVGPRWSD